MTYPLGVILAITALASAVIHLNQDARTFWDFVGFVCVVGGTVAVAIITIPWQNYRLVIRSVTHLFVPTKRNESVIVTECMNFLTSMRNGQGSFESKMGDLAGETLRDGAELLALGFSKEKVHEILEERIHQSYERSQSVANAVRSIAKYPPAFGLAGTVLGLVTLMREVSSGADAKKTGLMMAIALMATFYGLLTANLIVNPAGEHMAKTAQAERKRAEVALHAVILAAEGATLLEAQEVLNSYVHSGYRINVIQSAGAA